MRNPTHSAHVLLAVLFASMLSPLRAQADSPSARTPQGLLLDEFGESEGGDRLLHAHSSVGGNPVSALSGFVANHGQWNDEILFVARQGRIEATLRHDALALAPMPRFDADDPRPEPLVLRMPESATASLEGQGELVTKHHFLRGPQSQHVANVPGFERVIFRDVAPGIDLLVRQEPTGFAYDLHLAPGADLEAFELHLEGASSPALRADGVLVVQTAAGPVEQRIGASWEVEPTSRGRRDVASAFHLVSEGGNGDSGVVRLGFRAPQRDLARPFVLDPSLIFSTYIGGSGVERYPNDDAAMSVGPEGSAYLVAQSFGGTPTTLGAPDVTVDGTTDAWVGRLAPDGRRLLWATFLGGDTDVEDGRGVHLDSDGSVVVIGRSWSADFPTTAGSLQPQIGSPGMADVFISRLAPDGSSLQWSTLYGGPLQETVKVTALGSDGDVVVWGDAPANMPAADLGAYDSVWTPDDNYLLCVSADGTTRVFQSFFGPTARDIALDDEGNIYFAGATFSNLPSIGTPGAFQENPTPNDPFIEGLLVKLDPLCTQIEWATYLGGSDTDNIANVALDESGAIYLSGFTASPDFPVTPGAFDTQKSRGLAVYVAKLSAMGTDLIWSTFLESEGGVLNLWDMAIDRAGNVVVSGSTNGPNFPTTPDAFQPTFDDPGTSGDATLTKFDAFGESLDYSTYFGGADVDAPYSIGFGDSFELRMATATWSPDLFTTRNAFDPSYGGSQDLHASAWDLGLQPWTVLSSAMGGSQHVPNLAGAGELTAGAPTRFSLRAALPFAPAWFVVGFSQIHMPLKGGTLVPALDALVPIQPDANGAYDLVTPWPSVPSGLDFSIQAWIQDPGGPVGWSASNALQLTSQ